MAAPTDNSTEQNSTKLSSLTGEGIIVDIGTGDGLFVYQSARQNPNKFYIGIDANPTPLQKISERIHRKPQKGGAPNVLFIQSSVEDLPNELDGVAAEVHIHFPWGSLLAAVATGAEDVIGNIRRICSTGALLEIVFGLDPARDAAELDRLNIGPIDVAFIDTVLCPLYTSSGFEIVERAILPEDEWAKFHTTWAKRLKSGRGRLLTYIIAKAV
ncbi:MAG TPA: class I SAM-dependent methyltransferase [Pyrinomonadaceae bacterium]|nr:class I SAM-dependent methyltransferase [Pyrinomonadaceae bacterium]